MQLRRSERKQAKIKLALQGSAGSGKTMSALLLAKGLTNGDLTKQDYVLNQKNGKYIPEKVGLKAIQRNDLDYEFTIVFDIDSKHFCVASKDRTNLFSSLPEFKINASTGRKILNWCNHDSIKDKSKQEIKECTTVDGLKHIYSKYPTLKEELYPLIVKKKEELENQIIPDDKIIQHGNTTN